MNNIQKNGWWVEVLKGVIALIIGVICLTDPSEALAAIAVYLGILAILAGLVVVVTSLKRKGTHWKFWISQGIFNTIIGILLVSYPKVAINVIIVFISLWIIAMSIIQIFTYANLKKAGYHSQLLLFTAILSLLIGILLVFNPFEGAKIVAIILGIYATIYGLSSLYVAFKLLKR
jgi:uncharacterized membrane protein HdeD (DUF308 family)